MCIYKLTTPHPQRLQHMHLDDLASPASFPRLERTSDGPGGGGGGEEGQDSSVNVNGGHGRDSKRSEERGINTTAKEHRVRGSKVIAEAPRSGGRQSDSKGIDKR